MDPNSAARSDNVDKIENIAPACKSKMVCNNDFMQLYVALKLLLSAASLYISLCLSCVHAQKSVQVKFKLRAGKFVNQFELHEYIFLHTFIAVPLMQVQLWLAHMSLKP